MGKTEDGEPSEGLSETRELARDGVEDPGPEPGSTALLWSEVDSVLAVWSGVTSSRREAAVVVSRGGGWLAMAVVARGGELGRGAVSGLDLTACAGVAGGVGSFAAESEAADSGLSWGKGTVA
ncbi:unnamed protein product, partial [Cylindrotheca closterium]